MLFFFSFLFFSPINSPHSLFPSTPSLFLPTTPLFYPLYPRERLHQSQYVSKLEDVVKFLVHERRMTLDYLTLIWNSQVGRKRVKESEGVKERKRVKEREEEGEGEGGRG